MKLFEVGGCVRDEILGVDSKDIDFTVVLDESDDVSLYNGNGSGNPPAFECMVGRLEDMGFKIFLESPEFLTVRAQFPTSGGTFWDNTVPWSRNRDVRNLTADFVLARKEADYTDGRRPDVVVPGTLLDDLARRDFTMNAIAKDAHGHLIDPFNGVSDIRDKVIRTVGNPLDRFSEDALRAVRALRFSVTKGFFIMPDVHRAMEVESVLHSIRNNISDERIREEVSKMFRFDTVASIRALSEFPRLTEAMFAGSVSLDATMKTKGRGK